jgi:PAS domain S-box-containing protein
VGDAVSGSTLDHDLQAKWYRELINSLGAIIFTWDGSTQQFTYVNQGAETILGHPAGRWLQEPAFWLNRVVHPADRARVEKALLDGTVPNGQSTFEFQAVRADGQVIWLHATLCAYPNNQGGGQHIHGAMVDVTAHKQPEDRFDEVRAEEREILALIAQGEDVGLVLERLVHVVEAHASEELLASILFVDQTGAHLRHGAARLPLAYVQAIDGLAIGPNAGSCGTAAYRKEAVIVSDIKHDPLWEDFREVALAHNLRACWSTPILSTKGDLLGTFALYYRRPGDPSPKDMELIELVMGSAAIALERRRNEIEQGDLFDQLEAERSTLETVLQHIPAGVVIAEAPSGRLILGNEQVAKIWGHPYIPVEGIEEYQAYQGLHPDDSPYQPQEWPMARAITRGEVVIGEEIAIVRGDGSRGTLLLGAAPIRDKSSHIIAGVAIFQDISTQKQTEEHLRARLRELELIYHLSNDLAHTRALDEIYTSALDAVLYALNTHRASLLLFEPDGVMRFQAWRALSEAYRAAVEGHTPWTQDARDPQPILVADVAEDEALAPYQEVFAQEGIRALGFIPLVYEQRLLGKFMVYFDAPHHFTNEEVQLGELVANHVAFAIARQQTEAERLRLLADLKKERAQLYHVNESLENRVQARTQALVQANQQLLAEAEERRKAQEHFAKAFHANPSANVIAALPDLRYLDVNESFLRLTGYSKAELIDHTAQENNVLVDVEVRALMVHALLSKQSFAPTEVRIRTKSGEIRHVIMAAELIELDGNPCLLSGLLDITERKQMEADLRAHHTRLEELVRERTLALEAQREALFEEVIERKRAQAQLLALNELLEEQVVQRTKQVRSLASALTLAEQRERHRVATILHDHLQQLLYALLFRTNSLDGSSEIAPSELLKEFRSLVDEAITTTRTLTVDLSPPILEGEGLVEALRWLAHQMEELYQLDIELVVEARPHIAQKEMRILLFQSVREVLFNIVKHAAILQAQVRIWETPEALWISVKDQGVGFTPDSLSEQGLDGDGFGLATLRDRLDLFGGRLEIDSQPHAGTTVTISLASTHKNP